MAEGRIEHAHEHRGHHLLTPGCGPVRHVGGEQGSQARWTLHQLARIPCSWPGAPAGDRREQDVASSLYTFANTEFVGYVSARLPCVSWVFVKGAGE